MRLKGITVKDVMSVKLFDVDHLSDIVVIAGPNGVGKTRLINAILSHIQNPKPTSNISITIESTTNHEHDDWGKSTLNTSQADDCALISKTIERNSRRTKWRSSVLSFESDRSIQKVTPYQFSFENPDPDEEDISWNTTFSGLRSRWNDTINAIFRKVESRRGRIADRGEELLAKGEKKMDLSRYRDPIEPYKEVFSQLLAPKILSKVTPKQQDLFYEDDGLKRSVSTLSSGEKEVLNIAFDFVMRSPEDCIIFFDEPELHLHTELISK